MVNMWFRVLSTLIVLSLTSPLSFPWTHVSVRSTNGAHINTYFVPGAVEWCRHQPISKYQGECPLVEAWALTDARNVGDTSSIAVTICDNMGTIYDIAAIIYVLLQICTWNIASRSRWHLAGALLVSIVLLAWLPCHYAAISYATRGGLVLLEHTSALPCVALTLIISVLTL